MKLEGNEEISFCKEYVSTMYKLLRSETAESARMYVRKLQELEEVADKQQKTIFLETKLIPH